MYRVKLKEMKMKTSFVLVFFSDYIFCLLLPIFLSRTVYHLNITKQKEQDNTIKNAVIFLLYL